MIPPHHVRGVSLPAPGQPDDRTGHRGFGRATAAIALTGVGLLAAGLLVPLGSGRLAALVGEVIRTVGCLALFAALAMVVYQRFLHRLWSEELTRMAGPAIVRTLPPGYALDPLLRHLYGNSAPVQEVVHGVLGGLGRKPGGSDLTISTRTVVEYELRSEVPGTYTLASTVGHTFRSGVDDTKLVIFATCDPRLRDLLALGCDRPIYDWWYITDADIFHHSVDNMFREIEVGIRYRDASDKGHTIGLAKMEPRYVPYEEWREHLTFFREPLGPVAQQDPRNFLGTLRIYEYDLAEIEAPEHPIEHVEGFTLRSATLQNTDDGYCYWQPQYPCFVDAISFDVSALDAEDGSGYEFLVVPFAFSARSIPTTWTGPRELPAALSVRSWMLPGHGYALLWRRRSHETEADP